MLISNVMFALSQWIIISGLNYLGNAAAVGKYAYSLALAGVFLTIGQLGLRQFLLSSKASNEEIQVVFYIRIVTTLIAFLCLVFYCLLFVDAKYTSIIVILGIVKIIENISDICHGYFQLNHKITHIALSRIIRAFVSPLLFLTVYYFTENIYFACSSLFVSLTLVFYLIDSKAFSVGQLGMVATQLSENFGNVVKKSFPIGMTMLFVILLVNIPLFVLQNVTTDHIVGQYASIFYFVTAGSLVIQSVVQVIAPLITNNLKLKAKQEVKRLIKMSYLIAVVIGGIGIVLAGVCGTLVLTFAYGKPYGHLADLLVVAAVLNLVLGFQSVGGVSLTSLGCFNFQMVIMLITLPICYLVSLNLIPLYGAEGALYSGIVSTLIIAMLFLTKLIRELVLFEKT
ncbi:hypothetical protein tinsulaeT_21310 [Thalassotalea insulae]|uniref:O-antigen/teichoic acid export membrane protein n=2 Tax=Thalassotalea insulae TaxID=2056778 RepID=A0ABQ6GS70_9GAMM|nr:hypothetical protein tinsulaeT_21310 [Thalassotalea insulae]